MARTGSITNSIDSRTRIAALLGEILRLRAAAAPARRRRFRWRGRVIFEHDVADRRNRPPWLGISGRAVGPLDRELLAEQADLQLFFRHFDRHRLDAGRCDRLDAAGPRAAADAIHE